MFSTDALTWHFAIRHHLSRPESCEPERGFTCCMGKGWLQYHRWAARPARGLGPSGSVFCPVTRVFFG